jgi:uncharacterized protein
MNDSLRRVPCPTCRGPAVFHPSNLWRPFCSDRCRTADLGAWANEQFRVAAEAPDDGDESSIASPGPNASSSPPTH